MKNALFFVIALFCCTALQAQVTFGLKGGLNTQVNTPDDILEVIDNDTMFNFGVDDVKFGTQFGAYLRIGNKFYVQPEVIFNSNRTDYKFGQGNMLNEIRTERYQYLDFPLLVGLSAGPFLFHAGPVGHYFLNSRSELTDVDGYEARFQQFTWGWIGGLTIGKGRISADLRYEGNFRKAGEHINFFGDQYNFANNPARFMVNINLKIF